MSGHATQAAASAAMAAMAAASQLARLLRQNPTLAPCGAAERQDHKRQHADQEDRLHLVLQTDHAERGGSGHPERARQMRAASDHDQDHQREDHGAGGDELAAQDPRMHGKPAGEREGQRREQRNAPVAEDQARQAGEDQHAAELRSGRRARARRAPRASSPRRTPRHPVGIAGSVQASSRPRVMQQREPVFDRQNGQIGGVIHEMLRIAGIHGERAVDHHEIHVGVAPIDHEIAEQTETTSQAQPRSRRARRTSRERSDDRRRRAVGRISRQPGWWLETSGGF